MHVEIYTKSNCNYCDSVKTLMNSNHINYIEYSLNKDFTSLSLLEKYSSAKTYPVVIVDGFYIGGYNELKLLINQKHSDPRKYLIEE